MFPRSQRGEAVILSGQGCISSQQLNLVMCKSLAHDTGFGSMKAVKLKALWRAADSWHRESR